MVETRGQAASEKGSTSSLRETQSEEDLTQNPSQPLVSHEIAENPNPLPNIVQFARTPPPRRRAGPDLDDVITEQTEVLTALLRRVEGVEARAPPAAAGALADQPEDPNFNWNALRVASTTNFPVPSTGSVQRMASSLLSKLSSLQGRDNHDARFVLQMTSLWPDMDDEDKKFVFQRLNLYAIVATYGWPTAIDACTASSTTTSDCYLPPGVVPAQPNQRRNRNYRQQGLQQQQVQQQPQQQQQPRAAPQQQQQQQRPRRGRARNNP